MIDTPFENDDPYNDYEKFLEVAAKNGYKPGWAYYRLEDKYGTETAKKVVNDYEEPWEDK